MYQKAYSASLPKHSSATDSTHHRHLSLLISLINHLTTRYPSQNLYLQQLASVSYDWVPVPTRTWLKALTHAIRSGNYHQLGNLTDRDRIAQLVMPTGSCDKVTATTKPLLQLHDKLAMHAFTAAIDALRIKVRESTWRIMRSAFRELWLEEPFDTRPWLCRSLTFDINEPLDEFDLWLSDAEKSGGIRRKEGAQGRWIVTKMQ